MTTRFRCSACGNLTRFDVVASHRTRSFHHFSVGGDLTVALPGADPLRLTGTGYDVRFDAGR